MAEVVGSQIVKASVADVWESWNDFGNIANFHPGIKNSFLLGDSSQTGLGAVRQCDFTDGKNHVKERIVAYEPEKRMVIHIYDGSVPITDAAATLDFEPLAASRTRVTMRVRFTPKMGLIGRLMQPVMKRQFTKVIGDLLAENAAHVQRGAVALAA